MNFNILYPSSCCICLQSSGHLPTQVHSLVAFPCPPASHYFSTHYQTIQLPADLSALQWGSHHLTTPLGQFWRLGRCFGHLSFHSALFMLFKEGCTGWLEGGEFSLFSVLESSEDIAVKTVQVSKYYYHNLGNAKSISNGKCFFTDATLVEVLIPLMQNEYDTVNANRKF